MQTVHLTQDEAERELFEYVRRNWDSAEYGELPEDPWAMVEEYFSNALEAYEIVQVSG